MKSGILNKCSLKNQFTSLSEIDPEIFELIIEFT